jgi:hypothetical protein
MQRIVTGLSPPGVEFGSGPLSAGHGHEAPDCGPLSAVLGGTIQRRHRGGFCRDTLVILKFERCKRAKWEGVRAAADQDEHLPALQF